MAGVAPASPSPRRVKTPSWFDARLVVGVLLVLSSVFIGATVVSGASHSDRLLAVTHDLAAGTVLGAADVSAVSARLPDRGSGVYLTADTSVVGKQLNRAVARGELLAAAALGVAPAATTLTVPFAEGAAPRLRSGQRIAVWLSTRLCPSVVLLADVTVQSVDTSGGGAFAAGTGQNVVLSISPPLAQRVVTALAAENRVIRAGVLSGATPTGSNDNLPDLAACTPQPGPS